MKVGSRVAYSITFLRAIHQSPTGPLCHWRGVIKSMRTVGSSTIAVVEWNSGLTMSVNTHNIALVGPNTRYCST